MALSKSNSACFRALASSSVMVSNMFLRSASRILVAASLRASEYSFCFAANSLARSSASFLAASARSFSSRSNFLASRLNKRLFAANSVSLFCTPTIASLIAFLLSSVSLLSFWSNCAAFNRALANSNSLAANSVSDLRTCSNAFLRSSKVALESDNNSRAWANSLFPFALASLIASSLSSNSSCILANFLPSLAAVPNNPATNSKPLAKPSTKITANSEIAFIIGLTIAPNIAVIRAMASIPASVLSNAARSAPNTPTKTAISAPIGLAIKALKAPPKP